MHALVLAAGKGTRMYSTIPKVLQPLLGEPMIFYVLEAVSAVCKQSNISILVGHGAKDVIKAVNSNSVSYIHQKEQLGTGHALQVAWEELQYKGVEHLIVVNGDVPLIGSHYLQILIQTAKEKEADIAFLTTLLDDTASYGIVQRDSENKVLGIVEAKDFDGDVHGTSNEINTGIYFFTMKSIAPLLSLLRNENANNEYYITDLIQLAVENGLHVEGVLCENADTLLGVNTPIELVEAEEILREQVCIYWLSRGVHIHNYLGVSISPTVEIEAGAIIYGPSTITGKTYIHANTVIEPYCLLHDATIEKGAVIRSFSHIDGAVVGQESRIGPYARLRPEAFLSKNVRIGNFVEIKKSTIGANVAVNHLSYIGDATVGSDTNIGAGTITCNYDGAKKHNTTIGSGVFIGSITALIAPVTIEDNSTVGAGSVITKNVLTNTLALSRSEQKSWKKKP